VLGIGVGPSQQEFGQDGPAGLAGVLFLGLLVNGDELIVPIPEPVVPHGYNFFPFTYPFMYRWLQNVTHT
jgi:hypothetical protein